MESHDTEFNDWERRWLESAGMHPTGDDARDQLALVRAASRRPAAPVTVECLGDSCTGCSDPQCWSARADGGDV